MKSRCRAQWSHRSLTVPSCTCYIDIVPYLELILPTWLHVPRSLAKAVNVKPHTSSNPRLPQPLLRGSRAAHWQRSPRHMTPKVPHPVVAILRLCSRTSGRGGIESSELRNSVIADQRPSCTHVSSAPCRQPLLSQKTRCRPLTVRARAELHKPRELCHAGIGSRDRGS